jgi:hypothetical protein
MFVDLPVVSPHIKAGRVRLLAMASETGCISLTPTTGSAVFQRRASNHYALLLPAKRRAHRREVARCRDRAINTPARESFGSTAPIPRMSVEDFSRSCAPTSRGGTRS